MPLVMDLTDVLRERADDIDRDGLHDDAALMRQAANEIERLRSVVCNQNVALEPFAWALKGARSRLGEMADRADVTAIACRLISYDHLKDALSVFNQYKEGQSDGRD